MVNFKQYVESNKSMYSSEGRRRTLDVLEKAAGGEIWLRTGGYIDVKGRRIRHHGWGLVRLERFIKHLKELDKRVEGRIVHSGYLTFFINERVKNKIIKRNLWGAKEYRENFFGKEEDEGEVVRLHLTLIDLNTPWTLKDFIERLEELKNLKILGW
mgnify:CR=1 FL=1